MHECEIILFVSCLVFSDDCVGAVEWRTRGQVAEVENDKLMQMVTLLHQRLEAYLVHS